MGRTDMMDEWTGRCGLGCWAGPGRCCEFCLCSVVFLRPPTASAFLSFTWSSSKPKQHTALSTIGSAGRTGRWRAVGASIQSVGSRCTRSAPYPARVTPVLSWMWNRRPEDDGRRARTGGSPRARYLRGSKLVTGSVEEGGGWRGRLPLEHAGQGSPSDPGLLLFFAAPSTVVL